MDIRNVTGMDMNEIGNVASVIAAIGSPFAVYLAWGQLEVAKRSPDRQALSVSRRKIGMVNGEPRWHFSIGASGPGSFYDLTVHVHHGEQWVRTGEKIAEFDRSTNPLNCSAVIPEKDVETATLVLQWATGAKNTEGLDDRLAMVEIKSGKRYVWRESRFVRLINWWNRQASRIFHGEHGFVRPIGKWKQVPETPMTYRSNPGWPGAETTE